MQELLSLQLRNNALKFKVIEGVIVDEKKWTETKVISSSPGGGYVGPNGGYISGPTVRTRSIPHHNLWIKDHKSGKEFPLDLGGRDIPLRAGHEIFIVKADPGEDDIHMVFMVNRSTEKVYPFINNLRKFVSKSAKIAPVHGILRVLSSLVLAVSASIIVGLIYASVETSMVSTEEQYNGMKILAETIHVPYQQWKKLAARKEQFLLLNEFRLEHQAKLANGSKLFDQMVKKKFGVPYGFLRLNEKTRRKNLSIDQEKELFQFVNGYPQEAYEQSEDYSVVRNNAELHGVILGLCFCLIFVVLGVRWAMKPVSKYGQELIEAEAKVTAHFEQLANALMKKPLRDVSPALPPAEAVGSGLER